MSKRSRRVASRLVLAAVAVLVAAGGYVWVNAGYNTEWWCERKADRAFPALEAEAKAQLRNIDYSVHRATNCEELGRPDASLRAVVDEWDDRAVAIRFFRERGWSAAGDGYLQSPERNVAVYASEMVEADDPSASVMVSFFRPD